MLDAKIETAWKAARERYAEWGVDAEEALRVLESVPVSLHCWQGDDVAGFENSDEAIGGGLAVTGSYPGRARTVEELRSDLSKAYSCIPGGHRLNLHASYAETGGVAVERNELHSDHFRGWVEWAAEHTSGLDFNPTFFGHSKARDGWTLAHSDPGIRQFWTEHGIACRRIAAFMGRAQNSPCINNVWIPDGFKDLPVDRVAPRRRLLESLDTIFSEKLPAEHIGDAVECKLFGLGSESYVAGSHEFYLGYAITRGKILCLDSGHFHPTEQISDKISSVLQYVDRVLLHISRGIRWDSDHVVTLTDEVTAIAQEIVRGRFLSRVSIGLDFFDASINRIAAWVIGTRSVLRALLTALLEPLDRLRACENEGDYTSRLAVLEEQKSFPLGAVWDYYCLRKNVPVGINWLQEVRQYEDTVLRRRAFNVPIRNDDKT
jgi:L-rhamnose isomerase